MSTKVYGYSDDNVCFQGDVYDEVGCFETDLIIKFDDGTVIQTHYGKQIQEYTNEDGIWSIKVLETGSLFERLEECFDSDAEIYSDIAYFKDGLTGFKVMEKMRNG